MRVEQLIETNRTEWNERMIDTLMPKQDATLVEKIPLCRKGKPNKMIWRDSITGIFTVKSAYYKARRVLNREKIDRGQRDIT